ncbi:MAG TPA: signal recognition particle protein, partial [Glaciihabitans sp.]|nr:signal recognition particle protein [Glaciihabitans sp.]
GRLSIDEAMMVEIEQVKASVSPHEILFVVDAMTGQDAVNTAKVFNDRLDFTGVVLTKLDGDTRGGAALSIKSVVNKPIKFIGTGEKMEAIDVFHPDRMASRILDLGDIMSLIEQAQQAFDEEESRKVAEKFATDSFTLEDFLSQMQQLKKMGSLKSMLGMLPGARGMKEQLENFDESELTRTEAIIQSMTPTERRTPKLLNGSRRARIARGAGTTVTEVNGLVNRFEQAAKMMKTVAKGGMPQIPGMGPIPGQKFNSGKAKVQQKKGSKSGNPAKRAAENAALAAGTKSGSTAAAGSGFGLGGAGKSDGPSEEELASLQKFLGR